jgi:aspartyl-tRNA(Asn)/glutamyl-tRNA(Gln) amidotransferase subunit A
MQLVGAYLKRVDEADDRLRSFITVAREDALFAAQQADDELANGTYRGPLHGIPVGIKDLYFSGDIPTSGNSRLDFGRLSEQVVTVITKLRDAAAILVGKMDTSEFASGTVKLYMDLPHDLATNPWNLERFAGGSSSGVSSLSRCPLRNAVLRSCGSSYHTYSGFGTDILYFYSRVQA